ncbi:MAG TPA: amino acid adenylation domain-containing protein, partial [Candidatus Eisenbacteria bacterium]|nr:amino acid adenylation domain-containing protein [Candidatus Eisenbacteria bacterium]
RHSRKFKETVGLMMEVLPLRVTINDGETFLSLIEKLRLEVLEGMRYICNLGNSPQDKTYDVLLNYHTASFREFCGIPVETKRMTSGFENDSLALTVHDFDDSGNFVLDFDFHCDVFDEAQSGRAVEHFLRVLDAFLEDPARRIGDLDLLSEDERRRVLIDFNRRAVELPQAQTLARLFQSQVEKTPDHVAIACDDRRITYRELNRRANRLAHHLIRHGIGVESRVALYLEPSIETLTAILAVLKAGAAYVPLDPRAPEARLAFMLEDSQAPVLITQSKFLYQGPGMGDGRPMKARPPVIGPRSVVFLDTDWETIARESTANPVKEATPDNLAYVIYTSGSTGRPKAVMTAHRGVCDRLAWEQKAYGFDENDRSLLRSTLAFDTSVLEIFRSLLTGGTLIVARPEKRHDPRYLAELIAAQGVTVAEFVPSLLSLLLAEPAFAKCKHLKAVFCGGEVLALQVQQHWFERTGAALYNTYGPTEASIDVTHWRCRPGQGQRSVPIGRPVAGAAIYILDDGLSPVPIGVPGELYIGGSGLARGYWQRPDLTAERFIPDPFSPVPGARLYRTGDLARYLPDSAIEFVGRLDHQVKIRGFRVELGEIEALLREHPDVSEAVVVARVETGNADCGLQIADGAGESSKFAIPNSKSVETRIVAYVVPKRETSATANDLRNFLKQRLPDYMVPALFVLLDTLPLNANGKPDRSALPVPGNNQLDLRDRRVPPRTPTEEALARIWSTLLGVSSIGVHDDFFELGGHSLLAVRLFSEIEKTFNRRPPLESLFKRATIAHLAELIEGREGPGGGGCLVPIQPHGPKTPFFCVHEFFGDIFCYRNLAHHLGADQPFYGLQPRGLNGGEEPLDSVEKIAAYYVAAIRQVQPRGPYALGGLCFGGVIAFEMARQLRSQGESITLALLDSVARLDDTRLGWWRRFLRNLPSDLPSWFAGFFQLTRAQWSELLKIKLATAPAMVSGIFAPRDERSRAQKFLDRVRRLGEALQFSEAHHRVARAQFRALVRYKPRPYDGSATLFRASMQPLFSAHDPKNGWGPLILGKLEVRSIPGNHLGMLQEPHVRVLAAELKAVLGER